MDPAETDKPQSTPKRIALNVVAFAIGCAVFIAFAEAAVRLLDLPPKPLPPLNAEVYRLSDNPIIRYEFRPGFSTNLKPSESQFAEFHINQAGFRDSEFEEAKPAGIHRIVVLGDSITAGTGVPDVDLIYASQLEKILNAGSQTPAYQVYNLGTGGYNTLQEVEVLRVKGLQYNPDTVVIGFCVNDFTWRAYPFRIITSQLDPDQRALLGEMHWENAQWLNVLMSHSRLAMVTVARLKTLRGESERTYNLEDYSIRGTDPVSMALPILSDLQKKHGFDCYIFVIPAFDDEFDRYGHGHIHQRLKDIAAPYSNINVVDLFDDFVQSNRPPAELAWDGLHPTAEGHALLAKFMHRYLTSPDATAGSAPAIARTILKNGSFEVSNADTRDIAVWFPAPPAFQPIAAPAADAPDGESVAQLSAIDEIWGIMLQRLDLYPEDQGRTLVCTAYAKTPSANNLYMEVKWRRRDGEDTIERVAWPASPDTYTQVTLRTKIPADADFLDSQFRVTLRPGAEGEYLVDLCDASIE